MTHGRIKWDVARCRGYSLAVLLAAMLALAGAQEPIDAQDETDAQKRLAAWEQHRSATASSPWKGLEWRALGPKTCGGRIEAVDSPRGKPSIVYAGIGSGGVWKSVNGGLSWEHVFRDEATFAIGDVTVDPNEPDVVWVGTGEAHLGGMSYDGVGVYRSDDAGASWKHMGLTDSTRIGKVLVDPRDSDSVHVAVIGPRRGAYAGRGVHVSRDRGLTWKQTLQVGEHVGIIDLVRDPFDADRLWAAGWDRARGGKGGVFRSEDGGETWKRLDGGLLKGKDVGRVALAAAASERDVVYALIVDHSPPGEGRYDVGGALYRSDDGGDTWARTSTDYVDTYVGWDFCDVMVSPDDADQVYVCGLRLMVSRDGGETFARGGEKVFRLLEHPGRGMHLDMHDLWIDPANPDRILLGTDGGLYVSMDRAQSWLHLNNLPIAEFYTLRLDEEDPFQIWGGTQDNASLVGSSATKLVDQLHDGWRYVFLDRWDGGDGFATFPDPRGDGTIYYEQQNGDMTRMEPGAPLRWSRLHRKITPKPAQGEPKHRFSWNTPLFASSHDPGVLYCASQFVHRSDDRGDSWTKVSDDRTGGSGAITALVESPLDPRRLVAGSGWGKVSVTADGGTTWTDVGQGLPRRELLQLHASPHDPRRIYAVLTGQERRDHAPYLFRSDDFGATWTSLAVGLPHAPIGDVLEDPTTDGLLFTGGDLGVYASRDGGATWSSLSAGLPTAPVVDLVLQEQEGILVAATHGLSILTLDISKLR